MFRCNEPGSKRQLFLYLQGAENEISAPLRLPLPFHPRKLRRQNEPPCFWKRQIRLRHAATSYHSSQGCFTLEPARPRAGEEDAASLSSNGLRAGRLQWRGPPA